VNLYWRWRNAEWEVCGGGKTHMVEREIKKIFK
jgi:hypothetical protein